MTASPFRTTAQLGPDLTQVVKKDQVWYAGAGRSANGAGQTATPQPGTVEWGNDGREYMWVEASGAITVAASPGTQVAITDNGDGTNPRFTAAAGSGGWYAPNTDYYSGTIATGDRFWAVKGTAP